MFVDLSIYFTRSFRAHLNDPRQQAMYAVVHGGIDQVVCDAISMLYPYISICVTIELASSDSVSTRLTQENPKKNGVPFSRNIGASRLSTCPASRLMIF